MSMADIHGCDVTILRPQETSWHTFLKNPEKYNAFINDWLDYFRCEVEDIAHTHAIPLHIYDHQLTDILPDHRNTRWIKESDVLTLVNPEAHAIEYIEKHMRNNPVMRTVIGFSSVEERDRLLEFFARYQVPLFTREECTVARILTIQLQEEDRMRAIATKALLYPN